MKIKKLTDWASLVNIKTSQDCPMNGVSVDSRKVKPGDLFFALSGDKVDGHLFLEEVKSKGAHAAVVSKQYQGLSHDLILIYVDNPLQTLQESAKVLLSKRKTRVVGITGSVAKTSTKEFVTNLLKTRYKVAFSPGNSNSQIGLPLTLFNHCEGDEEILVLEMGMTLPGHITSLIEIAPPEVALITTIALVHACSFDSIEDIAITKAEIFSNPSTQLGIMPHDMPHRAEVEKIGSCQKISFSIVDSTADYFLDTDKNNRLHDGINKESVELGTISLPGKHNRHNILAAITVARYFGIDWNEITPAINSLQLPEKRFQMIEKNQILFINDSYNAAEISMKAAMDYLKEQPSKGRKIAVLGSMMELGKFSQECHRNVGKHALNTFDCVYCFGIECEPIVEVWKEAKRPVKLFLDFPTLLNELRNDLKANDLVLLKGSNSKQLWKILEEI
jgi:UDP-N-acetylmuramoyl-tripeptide--D-alanyl-D-alanine ligase